MHRGVHLGDTTHDHNGRAAFGLRTHIEAFYTSIVNPVDATNTLELGVQTMTSQLALQEDYPT